MSHNIQNQLNMKKRIVILFIIMIIGVTFFALKNQGKIMNSFLAAIGTGINIELPNQLNDISAFGNEICSICDFELAAQRTVEQGGASLAYKLPKKASSGDYYVYVKGDTTFGGGVMTVSMYDSEQNTSYSSYRVFSDEEMESFFILQPTSDCEYIKFLWSNLNKKSIPTIKDFQLVKINAGTDLNSLELGQYHVDQKTRFVELTEDDLFLEDSIVDVVCDNDCIIYTNGRAVYKYDSGITKVCDLDGTALGLQLIENRDIVVPLGVDGINILHSDGTLEFLSSSMFSGSVYDVSVYGDYFFVCEENCGIEVFRKEIDGYSVHYKYITNIFDNNGARYLGCVIYGHTLFANTYNNVYCYDLGNINHISRNNTLTARGRIADMFVAGDKLYLATVNSDPGLDQSQNYHSGMGIGTGYCVYDISMETNPVLIDFWRINGRYNASGFCADVAVYTDKVYLSLMDEGVDIVSVDNNEIDSRTNIRVLDERTKTTYSSGVSSLFPIGNEKLNYLPVTKTIAISDGLVLCCKGKGLYLYDQVPEKKLSVPGKTAKINKGSENDKTTIYNELLDEYEISSVKIENVALKQVKFYNDYLLASSKRSLFLFKKFGNSFDENYISKFDTSSEITDIYCFDRNIFTIQNGKLVCYTIDQNEQLEQTYEYSFPGENINSVAHCDNSFGSSYAVMTNKGVKYVLFDGGQCTILDEYTGASILCIADETKDGVIFVDVNNKYYYLSFSDETKSLISLSFVADSEENIDKYAFGWKKPAEAGYNLVSHEPVQEDEKYVIYYYPKVIASEQSGRLNWSAFSGTQPNITTRNISMYNIKSHGLSFFVDESDIFNPVSLGRVFYKGYVWDCDAYDGVFATAVGNAGVTVFSPKDGE